MTRVRGSKTARLSAALAALALFVAASVGWAAPASAQDEEPDPEPTVIEVDEDGFAVNVTVESIDGPGDLSGLLGGDEVLGITVDRGDANRGPSFAAVDAQPDPAGTTTSNDAIAAGGAAQTGGTGGGLAVTGSDVEPIIAMSIGLIAVGGSVLVVARRRAEDLRR